MIEKKKWFGFNSFTLRLDVNKQVLLHHWLPLLLVSVPTRRKIVVIIILSWQPVCRVHLSVGVQCSECRRCFLTQDSTQTQTWNYMTKTEPKKKISVDSISFMDYLLKQLFIFF